MSTSSRINLASSTEEDARVHCDVCVVGAGAAGIYLAVSLASRGLQVVLLEAGDASVEDGSAMGFDARFEADIYLGAQAGRFFGLGGSTSRWGGLLVPHTHRDARCLQAGDSDPWNHIVQTVSKEKGAVLGRLGWPAADGSSSFAPWSLDHGEQALQAAGFDCVAGLFLPFRRKNFAWLLDRRTAYSSRIRTVYNAVVSGWQVTPTPSGTRVVEARAVSGNGRRLAVLAKRFVVAAGAIESARILLELDLSFPQPVIRESSAIGNYLADHLSLPIADVAPGSNSAAISLFSPRFSGGWMRSLRFIESAPPQDSPRAFVHFIFDNRNPGFALAKEALSALQGRRFPRLSVEGVVAGLEGVARLAYRRFAHSDLYIPAETNTQLQLDIEQAPLRENRITLGDEMDRYGRRIANIRWRIDQLDIENIVRTSKRILDRWPGGDSSIPALVPRLGDYTATKPHDAYHPVGTCRMGRDREAVVDENLKVWGLENLWVVSTGVLPSAGTANPTFTMLCLGERLAGQLVATA